MSAHLFWQALQSQNQVISKAVLYYNNVQEISVLTQSLGKLTGLPHQGKSFIPREQHVIKCFNFPEVIFSVLLRAVALTEFSLQLMLICCDGMSP